MWHNVVDFPFCKHKLCWSLTDLVDYLYKRTSVVATRTMSLAEQISGLANPTPVFNDPEDTNDGTV